MESTRQSPFLFFRSLKLIVMLSRRQIRIKVLQILYAFFHSDSEDLMKCERDLGKSIEKSYDLYLHLLVLLVDLKGLAEQKLEKGRNKLLPSQADLSPNAKFIDNKALCLLAENISLKDKAENTSIYWSESPELISGLLRTIQESEMYQTYMEESTSSFMDDRKFLTALFSEFIAPNEELHSFLEEKSIYWQDDFAIANVAVLKTLKSFKPESDAYTRILPLFKDQSDEKFAYDLLKRTLVNSDDYKNYIIETASNWDEERISDMDQLLMQMAICELLNFETVPVKVSLNEYIELSKDYSSPKSKHFINGVIDRLAARFKEEGKIKKMGRGLVD